MKPKRKVAGQATRIFLSHSDQDRPKAVKVYNDLVAAGFEVWYSTKKIVAGSWLDKIGKALQHSNFFVLLLSPPAVKSKWVKKELDYALTHPQYDGRIVIAELAAADLEKLTWAAAGEQIIQLHPDFAGKLPKLRRAVRHLVK